MPRTRDELETAAAAAEQWLDDLDPDTVDWDDPADLRAIGQSLGDVAGAETALADAVAAARINGRSWGEIGQIPRHIPPGGPAAIQPAGGSFTGDAINALDGWVKMRQVGMVSRPELRGCSHR